MEFSPQELKHVEGMRNQDRWWPWTRWFLLGTGVFCLALSASSYLWLRSAIPTSSTSDDLYSSDLATFAMVSAAVYPLAIALGCFGAVSLVIAMVYWRGNPHRQLLLKLIDAATTDIDQEA